MQTPTTGGMKDFPKYLSISWTFALICCMFPIFSPAGGKTISAMVGSRVVLHCGNKSNITFSQLTWKMNGLTFLSLIPQKSFYIDPKAQNLTMNISESKSQMYALIIEKAQMFHTGNYTCEINTDAGPWEHKSELIITEFPLNSEGENWNKLVIAAAVGVSCVCCLVFIIALTVLQRSCRHCAGTSIHSPTAEMQEQTEEIYENCLALDVNQQHGYNEPHCHYIRAR